MKKRISYILIFLFVIILSGCFVLPTTSNTKTTTKTNTISTTTITSSKSNTTKTNSVSKNTSSTTTTISELDKEAIIIDGVKDNYNKIYMMSVNDTHGQTLTNHNDNMMGLDMVSSIINYQSEINNMPYIKISAGDMFQGSYISRVTECEIMIDALNAMGLHFMVLGNHEFDWGLEYIHRFWDKDPSNKEANFPLLCANLINTKTNSCPDWIKPYQIVKYGNTYIGFIGTIGDTLESSIDEIQLGDYEFTSAINAVSKYSKELRALGCTVIVNVTHDYEPSTISNIASLRKDSTVDAFICGHSHQKVDEYYNRVYDNYQIPCMQSNTKSICIGEMILKLENNIAVSPSHSQAEINHYYYNYFTSRNLSPDSKVVKVLDDYSEYVLDGETVVYHADYDMDKYDTARVLCDAVVDNLNIDFFFANSGGVRDTFKEGDIKKKDIFEVAPFDNTIFTFSIRGDKLKTYLDRNNDLIGNSSFNKSSIKNSTIYTVGILSFTFNKLDRIVLNYTVNGEFEEVNRIFRDIVLEELSK